MRHLACVAICKSQLERRLPRRKSEYKELFARILSIRSRLCPQKMGDINEMFAYPQNLWFHHAPSFSTALLHRHPSTTSLYWRQIWEVLQRYGTWRMLCVCGSLR